MESNIQVQESFNLFSSLDGDTQLGFSFLDTSPKSSITPPPPCVEVNHSEVSSSVKYTVEEVDFDGLTLLKGRVSTQEVLQLTNSDLIPGKYEGGLKLWEGSLDLVRTLKKEVQDGKLSVKGKRVLELGCGHGLPGIFTCLEGASVVHFQDFNAEVLRCLTIPNVKANLDHHNRKKEVEAEIRYFAGDWGEVDQILLPYVNNNEDENGGYDVILMAETVYSISTIPILYQLVKKCVSSPHGVVYVAAKKYYFGVGGGSRRFLSVVEKDGVMEASLISEVTDGSSNVREVWKLCLK
ncbi:histidine protein methyltransferase 1 homolog [Impatiens glandulifera]|uniref:histidine protein methyltransferase 1 homolog n=1 Tax=Impatiens glandulifera TaxID=253017 RepID=UPI001FB12749|nr:histidine protein methyltransferase 1 homolog [Impatiens glandulifera]